MTMRDYFAARALQGWIAKDGTFQSAVVQANGDLEQAMAQFAKGCYKQADAMLAERVKP